MRNEAASKMSPYDALSNPKHQPKDTSASKKRKLVTLKPAAKKPKVADDKPLPKGWKIMSKARESGKTKGVVDYYYISPKGDKYRSWREVEDHLAKS